MKKFLCISVILFLFTINTYASNAYLIKINGVITNVTSEYLKESIEQAEQDPDAVAFIIQIDTPGGLLSSTREIVQTIYNSKLKTISYVAPQGSEAGSAGTFITLAADFAVMSPGSSIGAAHPVSISGDLEGDVRSKAINSTESFMRSIAEKKGRDVDNATKTVVESKSFTAAEALHAGLIDAVIESREALAGMIETEFKVTDVNIIELTPSFAKKVNFALSDPNILLVLFLAGALMIFLEIKMPGTFIFAGIGIVCILIFLFGISVIPINFFAFLLIIAGIVLLILEIKITSYGLLALGGLTSMGFGMRLLFSTTDASGVAASYAILLTVIIIFSAIVLILGRLIVKDHVKKPLGGLSNLIGKTASVIYVKDKRYKVYVNGEIWNAESEDNTLVKGDQVEVISVSDMLLQIRKINS